MNEFIQLGERLGPLANLLAVVLAIIGAGRFIAATVSRYRQRDQEDAAEAEKISKRLRSNIAHADTSLGWQAATYYAQYYLNRTAQRTIVEQGKTTLQIISAVAMIGLLAWLGFITLATIVFISAAFLLVIDWHFLRRIERRYATADRELGIAWAEQLDRMKVPYK